MNKKNDFPEYQVRLSESIKALGHPARIEILKSLAQEKECKHGEMLDIATLAPATVNLHLLELKKAGFIKGRIMGKKSSYCLNWEFIETFEEELREYLDVLFSFKGLHTDSCLLKEG